ncbi:MAG: DegT/DnrJ/EryC1/StrS family aminotransferase [Candidatus Binatia bacterium]
MGAAAVFSFHPIKNITTGEGGMVTTDDAALAKRISLLRPTASSATPGKRTAAPSCRSTMLERPEVQLTDLQSATPGTSCASSTPSTPSAPAWRRATTPPSGGDPGPAPARPRQEFPARRCTTSTSCASTPSV